MTKILYNAICFFPPKENKAPLKYRNISHLERFYQFAKNMGCLYVNTYFAESRQFSHRKWLK